MRSTIERFQTFQVCNAPGNNETDLASCVSAFDSGPSTSSCSTILTGIFTRVTISDCSQSVPFSTKATYSLAKPTSFASVKPASALRLRQVPDTPLAKGNYVQQIISYYISPWQSIVENDPRNITVLTYKSDEGGKQTCETTSEVWVLHTTYVPVTVASTISLSTSFAQPAILVIDPALTITLPAGKCRLLTELPYANSIGREEYAIQNELSETDTTITTTITRRSTTTTTTTTTVPRRQSTSTVTGTVPLANDEEDAGTYTTTGSTVLTESSLIQLTRTLAL
ncbi:hypothetical protein BJ875DRAFT_471044 [Amylocarpus encephaloides]|uniref:Uncharacterized protein n=1 Tax=Amylocarpus encephaloides TaxID=45428 RepID=A0A9P7YC13_9HELO|nr:hypothetical protein BJ875DRAFT_471044 [Amylocarpus encephaloides]